MIINKLDYTLNKNIIISFDSLKISNINFLSKTVTILKEPQVFAGGLALPKVFLSNSIPSTVSILS